ncbi:MAG: NAD(P)/FAD-dependent oxidoreductase [Salinigranum sp.]
MSRPTVAVIGGAVGGLAAAERFRTFADVTLFERQRYDERRVNCGEAINDATLIPLSKTPENGFHNRIERFRVDVYPGTDRRSDAPPLARSHFPVASGYVTDRNVVERSWAERLAAGVDVREGENVTVSRYRDLVDGYDYVVDATGQPSLSAKAAGETDRYTGVTVALNADVTGEFGGTLRTPQIAFEGYVGYWWLFPKTPTRANVGIGWAGERRPENYVRELWDACARNGAPRPPREAINADTIPRGPSLDPSRTHPEPGVFLVGDAAGIANRYQGEGIGQAIRSSYLLADLVREGRQREYPDRLHASMRAEYRLAALMRGVWEETGDPALLAAVADAIDGLTVEQITRDPRAVLWRVLRRPRVALSMLRRPRVFRRALYACADRWEYNSERAAAIWSG